MPNKFDHATSLDDIMGLKAETEKDCAAAYRRIRDLYDQDALFPMDSHTRSLAEWHTQINLAGTYQSGGWLEVMRLAVAHLVTGPYAHQMIRDIEAKHATMVAQRQTRD